MPHNPPVTTCFSKFLWHLPASKTKAIRRRSESNGFKVGEFLIKKQRRVHRGLGKGDPASTCKASAKRITVYMTQAVASW